MFRQSVLTGALMILMTSFVATAFSQAAVEVAEHEEYGPHLVDGDGLSLYVFLDDAEVDGSACDASCAKAWPPLMADGEVTAGEGLDQQLLGTIERPDGVQQVTYDGWPLYRYLVDRSPGQAAGQASGDEWYLIAPDGTVVGADLEADAQASARAEEEPTMQDEEIDVEALMQQGRSIYNSTCAGCHGANGDQELAAHVRKITEAEETVADASALVGKILYGGAYMPPFRDVLNNDQVQAVATYVRNSFGYDFGPVTEQEVVKERERFD